MATTPTAGPVAIIKTKGGSESSAATKPAINWKLDIDPKAKDYSNFKDGRTRVKTLQDAILTFTLVYDNAANPFLSANGGLTDGSTILADCYTDATNFFALSACITKVSPGISGMEDVLMADVEASLIGVVTYPTA